MKYTKQSIFDFAGLIAIAFGALYLSSLANPISILAIFTELLVVRILTTDNQLRKKPFRYLGDEYLERYGE